MSRLWFATALETVATFWRVLRRDGVTIGFVTHDRDLWFDGVRHRAAPGMIPSALRCSAGLEADSADLQGALTHDALAAADLAAGRFDGAAVRFGLVDWQSGESTLLYAGTIGPMTAGQDRFEAAVESSKAALHRDPVPRTSPVCRARFCGPACGLAAARFETRVLVLGSTPDGGAVRVTAGAAQPGHVGGRLCWLDGPLAGCRSGIAAVQGALLVLDRPLDVTVPSGTAVRLREGCDGSIATCAGRFGNAVNFRGEPSLPGNDFVLRSGAAG
ncbi:DUF2163 domain-containing protein [Novosphingobium piscinae]|uniref:DUF2163 domain-containing protein n=1 Tax=Novosphingobium piscinae TaxID=1507448 RepID=A0A7X1KRS6_9SPHN|nr:DUF2163 domain-containing protein [Novosphingobium piscinae]MBC2670920.1 DUF2163 domain-containing protein [Novosphingobium piscinae]